MTQHDEHPRSPAPEAQHEAARIRAALDGILPLVQRPSRYLGLERNLMRKAWGSVDLHVALAFPDTYEVGMSHMGSQILYHLVSRRDDALAERCYAPWPDMAAAMRDADVPLYTLDSYTPVRSFDIVGISLQSELNYINVPYLLRLAGIPIRAADRDEADPLVIAGGPCAANPEPVADMLDAILLGDAEAGLDPLLDAVVTARAARLDRIDLLRRLARVDGVYVPSLYRWHAAAAGAPARWEQLDEAAPLPVRRVWTARLDPDDAPRVPIVPFAEVVQDRVGVEIMRGCTQGCRFCQAGFWYRPVREQDPAVIIERVERQVDASGLEEVGLMSLSTSDYSQVQPLVEELAGRFAERRVSLSLPSLRADSVSVELADAVSRVRKASFTIAPEAGSERLRRVINKTLSDDDVLTAAEAAFSRGWNLIKLYAMIGLPTETDEDLEALAQLTLRIACIGRHIRGGRAQVKLSIGCFVPKPWTPFQWEAFVPVDELGRRAALLRDRLGSRRAVRLSWSQPQVSELEALLARGDRRLAAVIERASSLGAALDGWSDQLDLDAWHRALEEEKIDMVAALGPRDIDEVLPWSVLDAGVRTGFLRAERRRALSEVTTRDCKWGHCVSCGIPGDGDDVRLAAPPPQDPPLQDPPRQPAAELTPREAPRDGQAGARRPTAALQPPVYRRYRISFSKLGDARFLSHRQVMDTLEKALRGAGAPARFTEGFNPHIRLSMGPALATGHEGLIELLDLDCVAPLRPPHLKAVNRLLPEGLQLLDARDLLPGAPSLGKLAAVARYRIGPPPDSAWPPDPSQLPDGLREGTLAWQVQDDSSLVVELNLRQEDGQVPRIRDVIEAAGVPRDEVPVVRVRRELIRLRPRLKAGARA